MSTELIKKLYAEMNERNYANLKDYVTDDYTSHRIGFPDKTGYKDAIEGGLIAFLTHCPDVKFEILKTAEQGDTVFVYNIITGFPGIVTKKSVDIFRIENSKIAEHWDIQQDVPEITT